MPNRTTPVTAASPPGGRPRARKITATPFGTWLAGQSRTVQDIATELKVSPWSIYKIRSGSWTPSLELAQRIAKLTAGPDGVPAVPESSWKKPRKARRAAA